MENADKNSHDNRIVLSNKKGSPSSDHTCLWKLSFCQFFIDVTTSLLRLSLTRRCSSHLLSASFRTAFQAASVVPYSGPATVWWLENYLQHASWILNKKYFKFHTKCVYYRALIRAASGHLETVVDERILCVGGSCCTTAPSPTWPHAKLVLWRKFQE